MKTALCLVRPLPHYRRDGFEKGLKRLGYQVESVWDRKKPADLLIVWNRHGLNDVIAREHEKHGKPVIVTENGYIGNDTDGHHLFALALDHHNGVGRFPVGDYSRWESLNIPVKPWRECTGDVLVLPQRGIGPVGVAMPRNWETEVVSRLRKTYDGYHVRVRKHPGNKHTGCGLEKDLAGVFMSVIWGSGAGVQSIINGIPVYHELPGWIGALAGSNKIDQTFRGDRTAMLSRVAWAQWSIAEIATGEPIKRLLEHD